MLQFQLWPSSNTTRDASPDTSKRTRPKSSIKRLGMRVLRRTPTLLKDGAIVIFLAVFAIALFVRRSALPLAPIPIPAPFRSVADLFRGAPSHLTYGRTRHEHQQFHAHFSDAHIPSTVPQQLLQQSAGDEYEDDVNSSDSTNLSAQNESTPPTSARSAVEAPLFVTSGHHDDEQQQAPDKTPPSYLPLAQHLKQVKTSKKLKPSLRDMVFGSQRRTLPDLRSTNNRDLKSCSKCMINHVQLQDREMPTKNHIRLARTIISLVTFYNISSMLMIPCIPEAHWIFAVIKAIQVSRARSPRCQDATLDFDRITLPFFLTI